MREKEKTVKEVRAQIETILEEKPELKPFQDEIDRLMSKIFDPVARLQVLSFMICGNIMKIQDLLATLPLALSDMARLSSNAIPERTNFYFC
jgi:hypothetical protein